MSIRVRCEHCRQELEAPESAAGKRGKCPHCGGSTYIPTPVPEEDVLDLAPIDEEEERKRQEEIQQLLEQDLQFREGEGEPHVPLEHREDLSSEDLHHLVVNYCLDLSQSKLDRAEKHAQKLVQFGRTGLDAVDDFMSGKTIEPALDPIPTRVLQGFLKQLRNRLKP